MHALVIYESEFGTTRLFAEAVGRGMADRCAVDVIDIRSLRDGCWVGADLLVLGVPTHARSMPTPASRRDGATWPSRPRSILRLEPHAVASGMREWLSERHLDDVQVAAFASRMNMNRMLSGSAAPSLLKAAVRAGATAVAEPKDFLVERDGRVVAGDIWRAEEWGRRLCVNARELALTQNLRP